VNNAGDAVSIGVGGKKVGSVLGQTKEQGGADKLIGRDGFISSMRHFTRGQNAPVKINVRKKLLLRARSGHILYTCI
jgi:hypothetical protein